MPICTMLIQILSISGSAHPAAGSLLQPLQDATKVHKQTSPNTLPG